MAEATVSPRKDKISVKHKKVKLVPKPSGSMIADFDYANLTASENDKCCHRNSDPQSSQMLSTADLISAIGYAWDRARWPHSVPLSETNPACKTEVVQSGGAVQYSADKGSFHASNSADENSEAKFVQQLRESQGSKLNRKIYYPLPSGKLFSSWRRVVARSAIIVDFSTANRLSPPNWGSAYSWMSQITLAKKRNPVNSIENRSTCDRFRDNCLTNSDGSCTPADTISMVNNSTMEISGSKLEAATPLDLSFGPASNNSNGKIHGQLIEVTDCNMITSSCDADFEDSKLVSLDQDFENGSRDGSNGLHGFQENEGIMVGQVDSDVKMGFPEKVVPKYALAKQEHAFAGAMAGLFVSLCLHPVDTVKTVLQSCRADQKPLRIIGSSIIAERGVSGLYRGLSSNVVSSAPISAVYTYTYESVKKNLLPLLPKEYYSVAHCLAGGCASVATSFIFTPSERIKQQMQVGSHYRNCWNAFIHIVQKGGVPSLYAGWRAVLCRNIPHSVIKFYTYESLKQIMLSSVQSDAQPNVFATLVCGGLSGSVASLFTTPFDVVKTRLQTQIPGSMTKYRGILTTLTEIGKHEGLKGLYRGLTPRLVMYMIQGALFFASYESFKKLFSLEVPSQAEESFTAECGLERS